MLFGTGLLAGLAADNFAHELDTFAFVGLGLAQAADFVAHLTEELDRKSTRLNSSHIH